ncbi:hypothetical protein SAMN02745716_0866 [Thermoleophilum album]|uniref:Dolichyl-phosphate-mannose-protein mannosyltransferase n=2 Tax=Thermoleophilum album TaxID=29539 RepID=A0A1H6FPG6_THEAL|nr:hypothetical protein SAMN02745716_0866 [Thermoleophilum album]
MARPHVKRQPRDHHTQAESGRYTDWLAPLLAALWHPFYTLGVGPGWILTAQLMLFSTAVFALFRLACPTLIAALATGATLICPPILSMLIFLSRDTWFAVFMTAAVAALAHSAHPSRRSSRRQMLALLIAAACLLLAQAARQNAFPVIATVVTAYSFLALRRSGSHRSVIRLGIAGAAGLLSAILALAVTEGAKRLLPISRLHPEQALYVYDLAALSDRANTLLLPPRPRMRTVGELRAKWVPESPRALLFGPDAPYPAPLSSRDVSELAARWRSEILHRPVSYVRVRTRLLLSLLGVSQRPVWVTHPGIDPNNLGLALHFHGANRVLRTYLGAFADERNNGSVIYRPMLWIVGAIALLAVLRRRTLERVYFAGTLFVASAIGYSFGLLVMAPVSAYRYGFPVLLFSFLALATGVLAAVGRRRAAPVEQGAGPVDKLRSARGIAGARAV